MYIIAVFLAVLIDLIKSLVLLGSVQVRAAASRIPNKSPSIFTNPGDMGPQDSL
jgi:hypothetical protein